MSIVILGIDLGKNVCGLVGVDAAGAVVARRSMRRQALIDYVARLPACVVAMELCCGTHHPGHLTNRDSTFPLQPQYFAHIAHLRPPRRHAFLPARTISASVGMPPSTIRAGAGASTTALSHVDGLYLFLDARSRQVSAKAKLGEAIRYGLKLWDGLTRFLDDGRIDFDNNAVERAIRPPALNRKNALFAGSDEGGRWSPRSSRTASSPASIRIDG